MDFFRKTTRTAGWMAMNIQDDGVYVAHIQRSATTLPEVTLATFYAGAHPATATTLLKVAKERHTHRHQCTTVLAPGAYQILSVEAPNVPAEEMKTAIRWRLKDLLDYPVVEATLDIMNIQQDKNSPAKNQPMYAVAARSTSIEQCQTLFEQAKIPLRVIDIPEMAQRNIATLLQTEGRGVALLSFNAEGGLLTITFADTLYLSRRIDVTLSQLTQPSIEKKNACYEKITLELQRSLDYVDRQYNFITLSKLALAPLGDAGTGLQEYMAANLYIPAEILNLETVLNFSKVPELKKPEQQQRYFMALGAALRDEEQISISLYNPFLLKQKSHFPAHAMAQSLGLIFLGTLLFYGYGWYYVTEMKKQAAQSLALHDATQAQLTQLVSTSGSHTASKILENEVAQSDAQLRARRQILEIIKKGDLGNTQGFSEYLRALSRQTADGLWITRFQVSGAGDNMTISGRTLRPDQVPIFIHHLKQEKVMAGKTFETLEMHTPDVTNTATQSALALSPPYIEFNLHNTPVGKVQ